MVLEPHHPDVTRDQILPSFPEVTRLDHHTDSLLTRNGEEDQMVRCIPQIIDAILLPRKVEHPAREITIVQLVGGEIQAIDETIRSNGNIRQVVVTRHQMVTSTV